MKRNPSRPTTYILYARKSTESEDRQVLSIDSQIHELQQIAEREGLTIVDTLSESRSAKSLGRPIFNDLLDRIRNGEANGILCWKLDRLARNFIDGGKIIDMLHSGTIQHVRAFEHSYYPQDNVLLMAVELGMANQFSRDLAVNVERGLRRKAELGWYPVQPPLGYLNLRIGGKGTSTIITDPERYPLVRRMWDQTLSGAHTASKILDIATEEWGLRSRSGRKLSKSNIYALLTNPFYHGLFEFPKGSGTWYQGKHDPMVTMEEYDKVQALFGRRNYPRPKTGDHAFTGTLRCGECGMAITADPKIKRQKNGNVHRYMYYHCTKKNRNIPCHQGSIEERAIIAQGLQKLGELVIPEPFHQWALTWLERQEESNATARLAAHASQRVAYDAIVRKIDRLIEMRAGGELSEDEFRDKKGDALKEKARLGQLLGDPRAGGTQGIETMRCALEFLARAKEKFEHGPPEQKRAIFLSLGSNRTLLDKILVIDTEITLLPMKAIAEEVTHIHERLEPQKSGLEQGDIERSYAESTTVCSLLYQALTVFRSEPTPSFVAVVKKWRDEDRGMPAKSRKIEP